VTVIHDGFCRSVIFADLGEPCDCPANPMWEGTIPAWFKGTWKEYLAHLEVLRERQACRADGHPNKLLGLAIQSNGIAQVVWWCPDCQRRAQTAAIKYDGDRRSLPVVDDNTSTTACEMCTSTEGVELHHYWPRHLFNDKAWAGTTAYLCRACHLEWHRTVTPNMNRRSAS
jgi:hypothetical protein